MLKVETLESYLTTNFGPPEDIGPVLILESSNWTHHGTSLDWSPVKSDDFAHKCFKGSSHDSYLMAHTASDREGIEL